MNTLSAVQSDFDTRAVAEKSSFKKALPVLLGNVLETYDFCLYGLLAPIFAKIFFPPDFEYSLMAAFFLFSMAYITRPIGAVVFGYAADKYGRKPVLMGTLSMVAIPAIGMTIIPSYETIGFASYVIIILFRLVQGIAFGGELPTAYVNIYEVANNQKKGVLSSLADAFANSGYLIGLTLVTIFSSLLTTNQFEIFGWRLLFLVSIIFIALLGYMRLSMIETKPTQTIDGIKVLNAFFDKQNLKTASIIVLFMLAGQCVNSNLFFHSYVLIQKTNPIDSILTLQLLVIISQLILAPTVGFISDKYKLNRIKLIKGAYILLLFFAIPIFQFLLSENFFFIAFGYILLILFSALFCGTFIPIIISQSKKESRVYTVAIGYSISTIFFAIVPSINEVIIKATNNKLASPSFLMIFCATISILVITFFMKNNQSGYEERVVQ